MERVETLCNRLLEQLSQNASPDALLMTVQMLQSELLHLKATTAPAATSATVAIDMPVSFDSTEKAPVVPQEEEKIIEILQVDEADIEAELEEIKRNAEAKNSMSVQNKPPMIFDPIEDTPTLLHQRSHEFKQKKELHESIGSQSGDSLNDKLKQSKLELSDALQDVPIKDLRKAININDRFLYISELFRGDEVMYERSIKTINGFAIYPEAEYWIKRELKLKLGWDDKMPIVKQFDQLVKRRFSIT
ncbi:MAG: hypothetical protein ABI402_12210 [Ferruginibacter sp.]